MQLSNSIGAEPESARKAVWLLLAVALNTLELFIPRIPLFPWLKPGLANVITMLWIIRFGTADALLSTLIRVWLSSFYFGFSLITLGLALSGGLLSTAAMGIVWKTLGRKKALGTVGMGITGAVMHNAGQLAAVYLLLTGNSAVFYQLPFMGMAALLFGGFIGVITPLMWRILVIDTPDQQISYNHLSLVEVHYSNKPLQTGVVLLILGGAVLLATVNDLRLLGCMAAGATLLVFFSGKCKMDALVYPVRFWAMFLFVCIVYLFFSCGTRIPFLPFVTYEGVAAFTAQFLRLWTWLEGGVLLHRLHCNRLLFAALTKLFRGHAETLMAGLLSLEYFPSVISFVKSREARTGIAWRKPLEGPAVFIQRVQAHVLRLIEGEGRKGGGRAPY